MKHPEPDDAARSTSRIATEDRRRASATDSDFSADTPAPIGGDENLAIPLTADGQTVPLPGASIEEDLILVGEAQPAEAPAEDLIILPESFYPWPESLPFEVIGDEGLKPSRLFRIALWAVRRLRSEYIWVPVVQERIGVNAIRSNPDLLASIEMLWRSELKEPFSKAQKDLLFEADCVLLAVDPETNSIVSYGSTRYSAAGSVAGVEDQITHGGHLVIATGHEKRQLGPLTASVIALYAHPTLSVFRNEIIVLRSNNRYIERLLRRGEPVYRSDTCESLVDDPGFSAIKRAIEWTHENVFHAADSVEWGTPMKIGHKIPDQLRMSGLASNETVYLARESSLVYFLWKVFTFGIRRKLRKLLA